MKKIGTIDGVVPNYGCPTLAGGGLLTHRINIKIITIRRKPKKIEIKLKKRSEYSVTAYVRHIEKIYHGRG